MWPSRAAARSLSITASTPRRVPSASRTTGMPPPPAAITTYPAATRVATAGGVEDLARLRRRDDAPPAPLTAVLELLAVLDQDAAPPPTAGSGRSAWSGCSKPGSSPVDEGAGDERGDRAVDAAPGQRRLERVHQDEAQRGLGLGAAPVQRHRGHDGGGQLVLHQEVADLRAVAMGDHDLVAGGDQVGDRLPSPPRPRRSGPRGEHCRRDPSWRCRRALPGPSPDTLYGRSSTARLRGPGQPHRSCDRFATRMPSSCTSASQDSDS